MLPLWVSCSCANDSVSAELKQGRGPKDSGRFTARRGQSIAATIKATKVVTATIMTSVVVATSIVIAAMTVSGVMATMIVVRSGIRMTKVFGVKVVVRD